jgi:hypothetical protein
MLELEEDIVIDTGQLVELSEYDNGYFLVVDIGEDFQFGFPIYKDGYTNFPMDREEPFVVGDKIDVESAKMGTRILSLAVNGTEWFTYSMREAELISAIRKHWRQAQALQDELENV